MPGPLLSGCKPFVPDIRRVQAIQVVIAGRVRWLRSAAAQGEERFVPFLGVTSVQQTLLSYSKWIFGFRTALSRYLCIFRYLDWLNQTLQLKTPIISALKKKTTVQPCFQQNRHEAEVHQACIFLLRRQRKAAWLAISLPQDTRTHDLRRRNIADALYAENHPEIQAIPHAVAGAVRQHLWRFPGPVRRYQPYHVPLAWDARSGHHR